jgi:hypothetical protein
MIHKASYPASREQKNAKMSKKKKTTTSKASKKSRIFLVAVRIIHSSSPYTPSPRFRERETAMANSKTLVEIVENSYCTAFSDILWDKKHGSREQVTESVFVCKPHLQGPREAVTAAESKRERSANLLCVQAHKELLLLLQRSSERECGTLSSRLRLFRSSSSRSASRMRSQIEILSLSPRSRFALYWGSLK